MVGKNDLLRHNLGAYVHSTQDGGVGGYEEEGGFVIGVLPGVFDGGAGLVEETQALDGGRTSLNDECRREYLAFHG